MDGRAPSASVEPQMHTLSKRAASDHDASLTAGAIQSVGGGLGQEVGRDLDLHVHCPVVEVGVQADRAADQSRTVVGSSHLKV